MNYQAKREKEIMEWLNLNKRIIAVDFDGTLCESNYPYCGKPIMPVIKAITEEKRVNYYSLHYERGQRTWFGFEVV